MEAACRLAQEELSDGNTESEIAESLQKLNLQASSHSQGDHSRSSSSSSSSSEYETDSSEDESGSSSEGSDVTTEDSNPAKAEHTLVKNEADCVEKCQEKSTNSLMTSDSVVDTETLNF